MEMNYDENTLHQLEQELNVRIVPGTEIMTDVGTHRFVKTQEDSDRVLVPQPSDDPNDPLNWTTFWKFSTLACANAVTFSQGFGPSALAPMLPQLIKDFDSNLPDVVQFIGVPALVAGFCNFFWVPVSTTFGRRPVVILSTLVCLASSIWKAKAQTYSSFMGACILGAFGAGASESIPPAIVADVMFLHERGTYNTMYFANFFGALTLGPIIAGPMIDRTGWRNFWWLNTAIFAFTLVMVIFGFPETKWHRAHPDEIEREAAEGSNSPTKANSIVQTVGVGSFEKKNSSPGLSNHSQTVTAPRDPYFGKGTPSKRQYMFFQPNAHPIKSLLLDFWIPWKIFPYPIVLFASFVVGFSAVSLLAITVTQSQAFAAPPYNYSSERIGFLNIAVLIGVMIGLATAGPLSDWISMKLTTANKGIREPEMRLPTMIPYVLVMLLGNLIVAYGCQHAWNWKIIVIIGYSCAGIQVAALPAVTSTYAVDSYKPVAGSIFVTITVVKNLWAYGYSKFVTDWIISDGYIPAVMTNAGLATLACLFGTLFWFVGKRFRIWTRDSSVHHM